MIKSANCFDQQETFFYESIFLYVFLLLTFSLVHFYPQHGQIICSLLILVKGEIFLFLL